MPTVFSHPAPVLALGALLAGRGLSARMLLFGVCCGFRLGVSYGDVLGHRGFSHSLVFAGLMGLAGAAFAPLLRGGRLTGFCMGFFGVVSHILLDAMTSGGLGVAAFWPFDPSRRFFGWRPIRVSPLDLPAFLSRRGADVLLSELRWVWLPCLAVIAGVRLFRKARR